MMGAGYNFAEATDPKEDASSGATLQPIGIEDIPERHPVRMFSNAYSGLADGALLPHADALLKHPDLDDVFGWATLIEPIALSGTVDFKVVRQGARLAAHEGRTYRDQWMSDTVDPEFIRATYTEVIAAAVLRRPLFSRGSVPHRARAFLYMLRGTFPVFADNHARLRLFKIEAQPYVVL
ncbi:MAG: hypothetical protein AAFR16_03110 [Pseudomonadota bacterium]